MVNDKNFVYESCGGWGHSIRPSPIILPAKFISLKSMEQCRKQLLLLSNMIGLQEELERQIQKATNPTSILKTVLKKKFQEVNITLSDEQHEKIFKDIFEEYDNKITIDISDEQIALTGFTEEELKPLLQNIFDDIPDEAYKLLDAFTEEIPKIITDVVSDTSPGILKSLKNNATKMLQEKCLEADSFKTRLHGLWGTALDLSEIHIVIALESGEYINNTYRATAVEEHDLVFEVLIRLHARSCQIASEILTLLKGGFADGAHARWRSLHEVAVTGRFIAAHDNTLAERYILHESIDSYKAALQYVEFTDALGVVPLTETELKELQNNRDELIHRYGKSYSTDYGWAATVLKNNRPSFRDIELSVGLSHLRPYYKLASYNVHGNAKGVFYKLGLLERNSDLLLAGSSNIGLAESGHSTALSLNHITTAILAKYPTLDNIIISRVLLDISSEIGDAYAQCHNTCMET